LAPAYTIVLAQICTAPEECFGTAVLALTYSSVLAPIDNSVLAQIDSSVLALNGSSVSARTYSSALALTYTSVLGRCDILALAHSCNFDEGRCDTFDEEPWNTLDWEHFDTSVVEPLSISPLAPDGTAVEAHFDIAASSTASSDIPPSTSPSPSSTTSLTFAIVPTSITLAPKDPTDKVPQSFDAPLTPVVAPTQAASFCLFPFLPIVRPLLHIHLASSRATA